jgi:tRNA(Ile)-lysidine synthase
LKIVIAVSGGIDSRVLLDAIIHNRLHELVTSEPKTKNQKPIAIVHFNHRMHAKSNEHEKFVEKLAQDYKLEFFSECATQKLKSEDQARVFRYEFLIKIAQKVKANCIALAHNQNDNIETFLFNLARGTGLNGLKGMSEISIAPKIYQKLKTKDQRPKLWRPLITVSRTKIEQYAKQHNLKFITDPTNNDKKFSRNFLRLEILPRLTQLNSQAMQNINRTQNFAADAAKFLRQSAIEFLKSETENFIELKKFNAQPKILRSEIIREIYFRATCDQRFPTEKNCDEVLDLAQNSAGNKKKQFGRIKFQTAKKADKRVLIWQMINL